VSGGKVVDRLRIFDFEESTHEESSSRHPYLSEPGLRCWFHCLSGARPMILARVGNDVVDLKEPTTAEHYQRSRFVARVCTADEAARVGSSDDPHRMLWSLFAAKEAGFKVVAKLAPGIAFSPRRFVVNAEFTSVVHDDVKLWLQVTGADSWVHAVAGQGPEKPVWTVERRAETVGESDAARALACRVAVQHLQINAQGLTVERHADQRFRDDLGPPCLLLDGQPLEVDLSLSHDGPWVACALLEQSSAL
jgi:phosphopantetheinyl transferase (holo-ACP synthase)